MPIGSYAIEQDYSHYVSLASKTALAVIGTATKGPLNTPTLCTSAQDLVNKFGAPKVGYHALYAGQYFLSQSTRLYFVRVANNGEAKAATVGISCIVDEDIGVEDNAITIALKEPGSYYNGYSLKFESIETTDGTKKYTMKLLSAKGTLIEANEVSLEDIKVDYETEYIKVVALTTSKITDIKLDSTNIFENGADSDTPSDKDYTNGADTLKDMTIDINLIAAPGVTTSNVISHILGVAEGRGDCLAIIDAPKHLETDGVLAWAQGNGDYATNFNNSYGAVYYDWCYIYDSINKQRVLVPPSVPVVASIAYSDRVSNLWFAPAGLNRGLVRGVLELDSKLSSEDVEKLYEGGINCLREDPQSGIVIWGQKTLSKESTALNRINVRRLMNYLKKVVVAASKYLVFEPNDRVTWNNFEMKVAPILDSIVNRRGIYEYKIVRGETIVTESDIDNYTMPCMIMIKPTKTAEEIPIYFTLTSTGADFNEVLDTNGIVIGE